MSKIYKTNPEIIFTVKEGVLKLIFLDEGKNHFIILKGAAAEALQHFNGAKDLATIKKELDQKFNISKEKDSDFLKMVEFFIKKEIIVEA